MTDLDQLIHAVKNGLLPAVRIAGRAQRPLALQERMTRYHVPGFSIALVQDGEIAWTRGYGLAEAGGGARVTPETLFQAASISKAVAAMAALRLVERGVLDLDADVNEALRSWQVPGNEHTGQHKVTLRGLLSHTAGLTVSGFRGYPAPEKVPALQQVLDGEPPANSDPVRVMQEPGQGFSYSGGGYAVLQQLLEDVTGTPFAGLLRELVLDPLGLAHSTFEQPLPEAWVAQAATAHRGSGEPVPGRWHTYPELAAAGLWTTPSDLARVVIEIIRSHAGASNAILSAEMTRRMLTPPPDGWYGLGLWLIETDGRTRFQHPGWNEGYHSYMGGYVDNGQGVAWMTNGENGILFGLEVLRGLAGAWGWTGFEPLEKTVAQVDPALYARYQGQYQPADVPEYVVRVVREGSRLFWEEVADRMRYELYPASDTSFFSLERREPITFVQDAGGHVEAVMVGEGWRLERVG
jgi:CubicO group peptidase (beta-lactamase class C family)